MTGNGGRLAGKVALISGASRGLGAACARRFVAEGAKVVIGDINTEEGTALAKALGPNALFVQLDVTKPPGRREAVGAAESEYGPVTVLVNNAGIVELLSVDDMTEAAYRRMIEINQIGPVHGTRRWSIPCAKQAPVPSSTSPASPEWPGCRSFRIMFPASSLCVVLPEPRLSIWPMITFASMQCCREQWILP